MIFAAAVVAALFSAVSGTKIELEDERTPLDLHKIAAEVNSLSTTWKATINPRFANATVADAKRMLGTILHHEPGYIAPTFERTDFLEATIPDSFDARTGFSQCADIIGHVRDQSNCGSCWAFSSTESFNDRYCIKHGDAKTFFAPEDTVSCCTGRVCSFSMGCNGGQPAGAWKWFQESGVSTGADWGTDPSASCKPYSMQTCAHHVEPPAGMVACDTLEEYKTPKCTSSCYSNTYSTAYSKDKHFATSSYSIKGVSNIQKEIMERGTISVAMSVYEDFEAYSSGVYKHVTGKYLGGHAIKMIGWGVENGTPYWLCVNSWNDSWGDKGTFKILRGSDECGIESDCVAGEVA